MTIPVKGAPRSRTILLPLTTTRPPSLPKLRVFQPDRVLPSNNSMDWGSFDSLLEGALFEEHEKEYKMMIDEIIVLYLNIRDKHCVNL